MRLAAFSFLAVPALVAANDLEDLYSELLTISPTDAAALSEWEASYALLVENYFGSLFSMISLQDGLFPTVDAELESYLLSRIAVLTEDYVDDDTYTAFDEEDIYTGLQDDLQTVFDGLFTAFDDDYFGFLTDVFSGIFTEAINPATATATTSTSSSTSSSPSRISSFTGASMTQSAADSSGADSSAADSSAADSSAADSSAADSSAADSSSAGSASAGTSSAQSSAGSSSAQSSSTDTSSVAGMGGHQAPALIGAALCGISVLFL
ncbi:hypothetical protein METBIDRAFT_10892 [Metschnikowia bicuspidata var. bicuspidata NRRL YB-4993]|uniref:Uncharacterized protein n=1 Tax=Metschnikowia bicuspidata var. bicuspidata NRRL YB-4993 TaxID=869754 RepID=A0A1A0HDI5_9ASCO|nr:hypothetical protein METBIDRAFT_10892 [Metschnikowia bicuspidata var. bicuspidata NRRL YB-4993]OBA21988.1 hypothetical protein METBIDRAFT_10892 [Metschnikowia bicuspidata var. bicuspidata NRRL YB-4993]